MSLRSIHEASIMMRRCYHILNFLKSISAKEHLTPEDFLECSSNKVELTKMLSTLNQIEPSLVQKLKKRQSKRRRQKRIRMERNLKKKNVEEDELEIEKWMTETRCREQLEIKKNLHNKQLHSKILEAEHHIALLTQLEKLDKARGGGGDHSELLSTSLMTRLAETRQKILDKDADVINHWREHLFGTKLQQPEALSMEDLLKIRHDWDRMISNEATASSIPIGWVTPTRICETCQQQNFLN